MMLTDKIKELQAKGYSVDIEPNRIKPAILKVTLSKDKKSYTVGCNTGGCADEAIKEKFVDDVLESLEKIFEERLE